MAGARDTSETGDTRDTRDIAAAAGAGRLRDDGRLKDDAPGAAPEAAPTPAPAGAAGAGFVRSLVADPAYGPLYGLLLTLSVVTGVVDAVSILALGRVFVANMTGNVAFAAFALAGTPGFSLSASLFALAGFLIGAYAGGSLITRAGGDRATLLRAGTVAELLLAGASLLIAALSGDPGASHGTLGLGMSIFGPAVTDVVAALLAVTMGIQSAVARKLAVPDLTTTVLTMTLTGLGAEIPAAIRGIETPGPARRTARATLGHRLTAVAAIAAGAAVGAVLVLHVSPLSGMSLGTALLAVAAAGAVTAARHPAPWRAFPGEKS